MARDFTTFTINTQEGEDVRWASMDDEPDGRYTWAELLMTWPERAYHHLVDYQPEGEGIPWSRVGALAAIPKQLWYDGLSADEYINQANVNGIAIWWNQRLTTEQLQKVRSVPLSLVWVLMCSGSCVYAVGGAFENLVRSFPLLFCSPQLAFLQMCVGQRKVCIEVKFPGEKKEKSELVNPVFMAASGPSPSEIRSVEGDIQTAYETINMAGVIWLLCKKPTKSKKVVEVPDAIKSVWLKTTFQYSKVKDYLSPEYYLMQMNAYSSWSFDIHKKQLIQVLENIPKDRQIVAPGDGIGLCSRIWEGSLPVISGDLAQTNWTYGVKKETIQETMERGSAPGAVLVLSYVLSLMTEAERLFVDSWPGPIAVIEPKMVLTLPGFQMVGPGVWVRAFESLWLPKITMAEQIMSVDQILFSENLLSLETISFIYENPAVKYWKRMRPLGQAKLWKKGEVAPLVVYSLPEWKEILSQIGGIIVYLVPLGGFWNEAPKKVVLDVKDQLSWREVYEIPWSSDFQSDVRRSSHWVRLDSRLLFLFSYTGRLKWEGKNRLCNIEVSKEKVKLKHAILLGIDKQGVMLRTHSSLFMVDLKTYEGVKLFEFYAENVGLDISHYRLPQFEKKIGIDEMIKGFRRVSFVVDPEKCPVDWIGIYVVGVAMARERGSWRKLK